MYLAIWLTAINKHVFLIVKINVTYLESNKSALKSDQAFFVFGQKS